jgi:hypothetical protein
MQRSTVEHVGVGMLLRARRVPRVRAQGGEMRAQGGETRKVLLVEKREREREEALAPILKSPLCSEFYIVNILGL